MSMPFALPEWMPGWLPLLVLAPVMLYALVFLAIPFAVFGVKGRLELLEARLDELQGEIRLLGLRIPEPSRRPEPAVSAVPARQPPVPPAVAREATAAMPASADPGDASLARRRLPDTDDGSGSAEARAVRRRPAERPNRAEPRLDWPR